MDACDLELRGWLRLARCRGVPVKEAVSLVERASGALAFADPRAPNLRALELSEAAVAALCCARLSRQIDAELDLARRNGWQLVHRGDPRYPAPLLHIKVPPPVLGVRGNVDALARTAIAIVGSRRPTTYGLRMAELLAAGVASRGLVVASGLARGIDARAHEGALDVGGLTVAVLGCGLDRDYPRENAPLAKRIEEAGALVSEFPPGTEPIATNFPRRNRIIVGLSDAVVIVEAEIPSGTLVTARWATEESRVLLAVPGRVLDPTSAGPISLIRDGVKPACTPEDIFEELAPERRPHDVTPRAEDQPVPSAMEARLSLQERAVLSVIPIADDILVDEVLEAVPHGTDATLAAIFGLEVAGLVESLPGPRLRRRAHLRTREGSTVFRIATREAPD